MITLGTLWPLNWPPDLKNHLKTYGNRMFRVNQFFPKNLPTMTPKTPKVNPKAPKMSPKGHMDPNTPPRCLQWVQKVTTVIGGTDFGSPNETQGLSKTPMASKMNPNIPRRTSKIPKINLWDTKIYYERSKTDPAHSQTVKNQTVMFTDTGAPK